MACHPDLVLKSKTAMKNVKDMEMNEGTVCRLCQDTVRFTASHSFSYLEPDEV
jgi:hypothetical protein